MKKKIRFDRETIVDVFFKVVAGLAKASLPVIFIVCATVLFYQIVESLYLNSTPEQLSFIANYNNEVSTQGETLVTICAMMVVFWVL